MDTDILAFGTPNSNAGAVRAVRAVRDVRGGRKNCPAGHAALLPGVPVLTAGRAVLTASRAATNGHGYFPGILPRISRMDTDVFEYHP